MKKSMLVCLLLLMAATTILGQDISFGYDAAGNRVSRVINYPTLRADVSEPEEEPEMPFEPIVYEEVLSEMVIQIAPNPTEGLLRVTIENLPEATPAQIFLHNLTGKLIDMRKDVSSSADFNISNQPTGIYVLRIIAGEKQTEWKIIKK